MKIGIFGGSFDPVHSEHTQYVRAAKEALGLDRVFVVPSRVAPHKLTGARADGRARLEMCRIAFRNIPFAEADDRELRREGTSYSYLTCRSFREQFPSDELYFLVGADMLEDFFTWKNPQEILSDVTLVACGRGGAGTDGMRERFFRTFGKRFLSVPFCGAEISSTRLRVDLAFGKETPALDGVVRAYISERGLYEYPAVAPALALENPSRREHSYRVALMATERARSVGVAEEKALLAAALHDCGKNVPLSSPLLVGFKADDSVPEPVVHQFTGAFLAERRFGIADEEILDAIRYHTSGRENMTTLGKLVFLSDLLEEARAFPKAEELREAFRRDLDECLYLSLRNQTEYLTESGKPVYPLTTRAYEWIAEKFEGRETARSETGCDGAGNCGA